AYDDKVRPDGGDQMKNGEPNQQADQREPEHDREADPSAHHPPVASLRHRRAGPSQVARRSSNRPARRRARMVTRSRVRRARHWVSGDPGVLLGPLNIEVLDPATATPAPRRIAEAGSAGGGRG